MIDKKGEWFFVSFSSLYSSGIEVESKLDRFCWFVLVIWGGFCIKSEYDRLNLSRVGYIGILSDTLYQKR